MVKFSQAEFRYLADIVCDQIVKDFPDLQEEVRAVIDLDPLNMEWVLRVKAKGKFYESFIDDPGGVRFEFIDALRDAAADIKTQMLLNPY